MCRRMIESKMNIYSAYWNRKQVWVEGFEKPQKKNKRSWSLCNNIGWTHALSGRFNETISI